MSIGPLAYGSATSTFALRNLHKSPWHADWKLLRLRRTGWLHLPSNLRRLVQVSCGWPQAGSAFGLRALAGERIQRPLGGRRAPGRGLARCSTSAPMGTGPSRVGAGVRARPAQDAGAAGLRARRGGAPGGALDRRAHLEGRPQPVHFFGAFVR